MADDFEGVMDRYRRRYTPKIPTWTAVLMLFCEVTEEWEREDPERLATEAKLLARDRHRCVVPGCMRRSRLEGHHIRYRSRGGGNEPENLIVLCHGHHAHGVHKQRIRIAGKAPHALLFELGCLEGRSPVMVLKGERKIARLW